MHPLPNADRHPFAAARQNYCPHASDEPEDAQAWQYCPSPRATHATEAAVSHCSFWFCISLLTPRGRLSSRRHCVRRWGGQPMHCVHPYRPLSASEGDASRITGQAWAARWPANPRGYPRTMKSSTWSHATKNAAMISISKGAASALFVLNCQDPCRVVVAALADTKPNKPFVK